MTEEIALVLAIFPVLTVVGSVLVVTAVLRDPHLRTSTNIILVSLAVADSFVGILVMPFAIFLLYNGLKWNLPSLVCDAFLLGDVLASTASIVHLMAISVDRFNAVIRYTTYKSRNNWFAPISVSLCWLFSIMLASPILVIRRNASGNSSFPRNYSSGDEAPNCDLHSPLYMLYGSLFAFYIPCIIMFIMYSVIFASLRKRLQAVKFKEMAAENFFTFGHNVENMLASAYGDDSMLRKHTLKWAMPFLHDTAMTLDEADSDESCVSAEDLDELSAIFGKLDNVQQRMKVKQSTIYEEYSNSNGETIPLRKLPQRSRAMSIFSLRKASCAKNPADTLRELKGRAIRLIMKMRSKQGKQIRKETKATELVAIVLTMFLICWLPFFTLNIAKAVNFLYHPAKWTATWEKCFLAATWLGYINSCLNPFIYSAFNRRFRIAIINTIRCRKHEDMLEAARARIRKQSEKIQTQFGSQHQAIAGPVEPSFGPSFV